MLSAEELKKLAELLKIEKSDEATGTMIFDMAEYDESLEGLVVTFVHSEENDAVVKSIFYNKSDNAKFMQVYQKDPKLLYTMFFKDKAKIVIFEGLIAPYGSKEAVVEEFFAPPIAEQTEEVPGTQETEISENTDEATGEESLDDLLADVDEVSAKATETPIENVAEQVNTQNDESEITEQGMSEACKTLFEQSSELLGILKGYSERIDKQYGIATTVFNPDGSFKGFTDENLSEISAAIKELDQSVNLGNLNEEFILKENEIQEVAAALDTYAPTLFKQFVISLCIKAETERDRYYVSNLLTKFLEYTKEVF